ncbi:ATP-dependent DNA helicase RecG [Legionella tunisiensis]|uniref:ATP-dependent DNA helicase RecG n=1 Tax=Legionella tunisiensis TaxID=1034944 RepID=UPI00035F932E|nr:ATP-dependent DNA helicase RecG [Legionella tunisiensis]
MLHQSCEILAGVGPTLSAKLSKCGITTVADLLFHLPYRYQDRTRITAIRDLRANDWAVIVGRVCKTEVKYGKRMMLYCHVEDKTGILQLRFFHFNKQQIKALQECTLIRAFGEVREFANKFEMIHPEYQLLANEEDCIVDETLTPIYPSTQGLTQSRLRQLVKIALKTCHKTIDELEWMTIEQLQQQQFYPLSHALTILHNPPPDISLQTLEEGTHPALQRLVFDELLGQRLAMQFARQHRSQLSAPLILHNQELQTRFIAQLPFVLTAAQQRINEEISTDLSQSKPMLRLVQGDVGSGKTVVAALAALQAIANGYQVAFMAPTELLSEQHAANLETWFNPLGICCRRLSGNMKTSKRKETLTLLANHGCQILIGTHALFQENVLFAKLGLVIIDEQHRFGVEQRLLLQQKGQQAALTPHQLLMTATPIPRTLAMTQFAHLDLSIIDELPPGRTPISTAVLSQEKREPVINRLQSAIADGRQAYWVCTLIEESEKLQCMAATATAENLQAQLPNVRVGLVHGRMKSIEKEATMAAFKQGEIDLLVATTVIEVGVDVPKASLMIIENAERLGLSQLHQLRGRVGRGSAQSHCLLLYQSPLSQLGAERLRIMRATCDGFIIAEKDLQLRGAGEVLGTRQTGYHQFKIANLQRDHHFLPVVANTAKQLVLENPQLARTIAQRWLGDFEQFLQG